MTKKQLTIIGAVAAVGGGLVTLHGVTSKRWQKAHTGFAVLSGLVGALSFIQSLRTSDSAHSTLAITP